MRYESALQIIGYLKRAYSAPVSILRIAQNIDLSYQPTHKHVRALAKQGAIELAKQGREVLCRLKAGTAAHLWLSLLAVEERVAPGGVPLGQTHALAALRDIVPDMPTEGLEALALQQTGNVPRIVVLAESYARDGLRRRFAVRCESLGLNAEILVLSFADLAQLLADPLERERWVTQSTPVYGEQRFWEAVLPDNGVPPLEESL